MANRQYLKVAVIMALVAIAGIVLTSLGRTAPADPAWDLVIKNGRVIDPQTGRDEIATVAISGGIIRKIVGGADAPVGEARQVIDAAGKVVSPGFINTHTHEGSVANTLENIKPVTNLLVFDGITFWLGGNCGFSPTGVRMKAKDGTTIAMGNPDKPLTQFLDELDQIPLYNHYGTLSGNNTLRSRMQVLHMEKETDAQIAQMKKILAEEVAAGSFGVSYGLMYDMGASEKGCLELARASQAAGGMAASHTRYPTFNLKHLTGIDNPILKRSIYEAIRNCRTTRVPFIVSHITDMAQADSTEWTLKTIEKGIDEGLPLAGDIIGADWFINDFRALTLNGAVPISVLMKLGNYKIDQFYMAGDIYIDGKLIVKKYGNLTMEQAQYLAKNAKKVTSPGAEGMVSIPLLCKIVPPKDTIMALKYPWVFVGNDVIGKAIDPATGEPDPIIPRGLATFSRLLGHWSRDENALSLKEALFKATIGPAMWLGLDKKGRLQEGCDADIVIFDPATIIDRAGWLNGEENIKPNGISHVIVSGQVVVENNKLTGATPGRLIRRTWKINGNTAEIIALHKKLFGSRGNGQ